eukprot:scaffold160787_cov45-Prasinocladus_malaysianus.AAC.1
MDVDSGRAKPSRTVLFANHHRLGDQTERTITSYFAGSPRTEFPGVYSTVLLLIQRRKAEQTCLPFLEFPSAQILANTISDIRTATY